MLAHVLWKRVGCRVQLNCDGTRWRTVGGKWRGNWRMEWVASTLHTTSEHGVSSITTITTADAHTSAASSRLNWRPRRFKWTRPFRRKMKSACAITLQTQSNTERRSIHPVSRSFFDCNQSKLQHNNIETFNNNKKCQICPSPSHEIV